jgi:hypothetical protein
VLLVVLRLLRVDRQVVVRVLRRVVAVLGMVGLGAAGTAAAGKVAGVREAGLPGMLQVLRSSSSRVRVMQRRRLLLLLQQL